ncbi:MAG: heme A synthase [Actinobacteria bacterium]|nr:heme A synthase [Actinomycetota bacterium]
MGRLAISPRAYRRITFVAALALAVIILTGAAVRLTGSGLGCPTWPQCEPGQLVAKSAAGYHQQIEFWNRAFTAVVSIAVMLAVLGSLVRRPRRRELTWLSIGLVVGVIAQAILGGLVVKEVLAPPFVMGHFLLSIVLLWNAVLLHHRAGQPAGRSEPVVDGRLLLLGRAVFVLACAAIVTGTVVTGTGPHAGDKRAARLNLVVTDVARVHGTTVMIFLGTVLLTLWLAYRRHAPAVVRQRLTVLLVVLVAQAAVGYTQYFTGVPVLLVAVHVAGATALFAATVSLYLSLRARTATEEVPSGQLQPSLARGTLARA